GTAPPSGCARRADRADRRGRVAEIQRRGDRRRRRARAAVPYQPRDLGTGLRHRSRADFNRGAHRHRRVPPHQPRGQADARGGAGADRVSATDAGGPGMKLLKAIIRPSKVDEVKDALAKLNISGMTVTEVRGHGKQKGHTAIYRGKEYNVSLLPKMQIEVVVTNTIADEAIRAIVEAARTGEIGDGRVFVLPVERAYRIRTGEQDL